MEHFDDVIDELKDPTRSLRDAIPAAWTAFDQLHHAAIADGVLPASIKELMALTLAVVKRCDACIAYHAKAAARRGATAGELAEALGVALLMDGGTASVYGPMAWNAYREFAVGSGTTTVDDAAAFTLNDESCDLVIDLDDAAPGVVSTRYLGAVQPQAADRHPPMTSSHLAASAPTETWLG